MIVPLAVGTLRAEVIETELGKPLIRIEGGINVRHGRKGRSLTLYEAERLHGWLQGVVAFYGIRR